MLKYQYQIFNMNEYKEKKNKISKRKQRVFFFGERESIKLLSRNYTKEFFLDITFKIIPHNFKPYKLLVISRLPENSKYPVLLIFILLKYLDNIIYDKIFNYLYENFNFFPNIIHTDFEILFN